MILSQMLGRFLAALLALALGAAQDSPDGLPPGILLLSRIKRHVAAEMARLPDYTCLQTAQRYHKPAGPKAVLKPLDTLRLEVLNTGDRELYAQPGSRRFDAEHPGVFTDRGLTGTGVFALSLNNLMVNNNGLFQYRGEERLDGRRAVRYDYRVPILVSGFTIDVEGIRGKVATKGSFWADPETLDLLRLDIVADEIPPNLPLESSVSTIRYARTRIGDRTIMLPETAQVDLVETGGVEDRNVMEFTHCRAFQSESTVSFGPATGLPPSEAPAEEFPAGVSIVVALAAPITGTEAVGAPVEGRIAATVTVKGRTIVPEGAIVRGRIRRIEPRLVAIEFTEIETGEVPARFFADLESVDPPAAVAPRTGGDLPGVGSISTPKLPLPAGFRMVWRTKGL
jgi:hypothetical protein